MRVQCPPGDWLFPFVGVSKRDIDILTVLNYKKLAILLNEEI